MARRKSGSADQGSLWSLSYETVATPEGSVEASKLTLERPDEQYGKGSKGDGGADERSQISEPARESGVTSMEVPSQGVGTLRFDWGAVTDAPASDKGMLGVVESVPEVGDVPLRGSRSGLPETPGSERNELIAISVPVFQIEAGPVFFSTRSSAFDGADANSRGNDRQMSSATLRLRFPQVLAKDAVIALASNATGQDRLRISGHDGAMDAERTVFFAGRSAEITGRESKPLQNIRNYQIPDEKAATIGLTADKAKIAGNLAAVGLLKAVEREQRSPTPEEQARLASYVDFGGLRKLWDQSWVYREENKRLAELLSPDEIHAIKETSINTHYTSMAIVDRVWEAAQRLGFDGGRVLEPGMGVGNFFGRIPARLAASSELTGIEKNVVSGRMAQTLYPDARIVVKPFENVLIPNKSMDLIVGNPPFAEIKIFDPEYAHPKLSTHNYFIVKSLDKLKPGGIAALITSHYTLDSASDTARVEMAKRADLVAAIRLPNNAFERNAGTSVTADILFFRKKDVGELSRSMEDWTQTVEVDVEESGKTVSINSYFAEHPEMVLGRNALTGGQYSSEEYTVEPTGALDAQLAAAIESLPRNVVGKAKHEAERPRDESLAYAPSHIKEGAFFVDEGKVWTNQRGQRAALAPETSTAAIYQLKSLVGLRDAVNETLRVQKDGGDDTELAAAQEMLTDRYDAYRALYGPLTGVKTQRVFEDDPEYPLLTALENVDPESERVSKADIFTKRTTRPYSPLRELPSDPQSAMLKVLAETGRLDTGLMATLLKRSEEAVIASLIAADLVYQDPVSGEHVTADEYLSGPVRVKLEQAKRAAEIDPAFARNVASLEKAQPEPLSIVDIDARLGQTWIPTPLYVRFLHEHLAGQSTSKRENDQPGITRDTAGRWFVKLPNAYNDFSLSHEWAGGPFEGHKLMEFALNQAQPTAYLPPDPDGKRSVDIANTAAARVKLQEIKHEFKTWIKSENLSKEHPALEKLYNDAHNGVQRRIYSGKHLEFPGLSVDKQPRDYQAASVWRIAQEGRALIDHFVGAGKTLTMIAAGMELRRMGLSNKNLYVVPNNMVPQWREDFKSAYPAARVLAVTDQDLASAKNRRRLFSRIATNDWDAVIVPHSQFNMLPISPERESLTVQRQIDEMMELLADKSESKAGGPVDKRTERQMQVAVQKLEQRLKELTAGRKDNTVYFDDLGVDQLFVDEAHFFKALPFATKMGNISGLSTRQSQRAQNMLAKIEYLYDTHNNRGVVFATGTAITNTLGESYTMSRYLAPDVLQRAGIKHFDDWAANFAETTTKLEYAVDGATIRPKTSLSTFVNVPELRQLWAQFADVVTQDAAVAAGYIKVPYAMRKDELVEVTPEQEPMLQEIAERGEALMLPRSDPNHPDPTVDNWLKLDSDARDISLDARMRDSSAGDHPGSKVNAVVRLAKDVYDRTKAESGTVLVFADRYATSDGKFNIFTDIKAKLVAQGVTASEVAVVHDYATRKEFAAMQSAMRAGRIRILLGTTEKMGVGLNVQNRLKAEIHVDMPQRPDQVEQREGRIVRFGNMYDQVEIYRLITKPRDVNAPKAHDLQRAQLLERKQTFLTQFKLGGQLGRHMEDIAGDVRLSPEIFALAKAQATGNPLAMEKVKLENEIRQISLLDRANQLARHRNKQELDQKRMDLEYGKTLLPKVESAIQKRKEHEIRDGEGKLISLKIVFNDQQFSHLKDATEYLKARPKVDDDTLLEVNEIAIDINTRRATRTDLASGQMFTSTLVEYKLAGEWFDAPKGEVGGTTSAQSLVTSVLVRMRDLDQRAERIREDIEQSGVSIERLTSELERPSAYSESLRSLNRRLDEVSAELLGEVKGEDVIADSNAVERDDADPDKGTADLRQVEGKQEVASHIKSRHGHDAKAVATFERHARKLVEQYGQGIEPGKADLLVAVKMAQGGWTATQVIDGVRVAGFRKTVLQGVEMQTYAGKVSEQAANAASHAKEQSSLRHDQGLER